MENVPNHIALAFILTTVVTCLLFYQATQQSGKTAWVLFLWLVFQSGMGLTGFYTQTQTLPPRFLFLVLPPILFILMLFLTKKGNRYLDSLHPQKMMLMHAIRIPVELVLYALFVFKAVPQLMTFEGRNFDILAGISAPILSYFSYTKGRFNKKVLLIWNVLCLGLLLNIVGNAIVSAPFPFQQLAFDQPNVAVLYFPYIWLPSCVVPLVLLCHLATIRQLIKGGS